MWRRAPSPTATTTTMTCTPKPQSAGTPEIWNPLPFFTTVHQDSELGNIQTLDHFFADVQAGTLPAVSWVVPNGEVSEHPPALVEHGTGLRDRAHQRHHAEPSSGTAPPSSCPGTTGVASTTTSPRPRVDVNGYGLRVPGLVISPYAKRGYIDHQTLSFDAYVKFIEDDFLGSQRIDPQHRRPAGSPAHGAGGRPRARRPHPGLRFQPGAAAADGPAGRRDCTPR